MTEAPAPRRSARVLLFDDEARLVLIRRTRPDGETYLTTPGGGVWPDETWEAAAARECAEELGAEVVIGPIVWAATARVSGAESVLRFFVARLVSLDERRRTGHEFSEPWRGTYETVRVALDESVLDDFRPSELVPILRERGRALASEAAALVTVTAVVAGSRTVSGRRPFVAGESRTVPGPAREPPFAAGESRSPAAASGHRAPPQPHDDEARPRNPGTGVVRGAGAERIRRRGPSCSAAWRWRAARSDGRARR